MASIVVGVFWFLIVGWWATPLVVLGAWLANVTVVGRSLALRMANGLPVATALRDPWEFTDARDPDLPHPVVRAGYFLLVGWWASLLVAVAAAFTALTVVALPVAAGLLRRMFYAATLRPVD